MKTLSGDAAGFAIVLMTGDGSYLSRRAHDDLRTVGLSHILSISGLHVGLLAGIVFFAIRGGLSLVPFLRCAFKPMTAVLVASGSWVLHAFGWGSGSDAAVFLMAALFSWDYS